MNPSGVRFGTSDLYNILSHPDLATKVLDGIAIGQQRSATPYSDPTERVILFVKVVPEMSSGTMFPSKVITDCIRRSISRDLSKRHIPTFIYEVEDIPYNVNGKKMEIQLKAVCNRGHDALITMKLTDQERAVLERYTRFFRVEQVQQKDTAKL